MKTLFTILAIALSIPIMTAHPTNGDTARELAACLEAQLTEHNWDLPNADQWDFLADGILIAYSPNTTTARLGTWDLAFSTEGLTLQIDLPNEQLAFLIDADCNDEQLALRMDGNGLVIAAVKPNMQALRWLPGDWQEGFRADAPYLSFQQNGGFRSAQSNNEYAMLDTGRWTLANDGRVLLVYDSTGKIQVFVIKHLQMDELVLSPLTGNGKDLYLNKI